MQIPVLPMLLLATAGAALLSCSQHDADGKHHYTLERIVGFGTGGGSELFKQDGWAQGERLFTWTVGPRATLKFKVAANNQPLGLRMRLAGLLKAPELPFQTVEVVANGTKIAEWRVTRRADFAAVIPSDVVEGQSELTIELRLPQASTPKALGLNADLRPLGVSCFELQITKAVSVADIWPERFPRDTTPRS